MNMRRSKSPVLCLVLAMFCCGVLASAQSNYRIAGKVVNSITGAPLAKVHVTLSSVRDRQPGASMVTGPDGAFVFSNLEAGKYSLFAARRGYIESYFNAHGQFSTAIVTGGDADPEHLVFRLTPQAILTGRALDESGDPLRNASVTLYRQERFTGRGMIRRVAAATTDDQGAYEFPDLASGDYFVAVNAKPWYALHPRSDGPSREAPASIPANHSMDVAYPTTYYAGVVEADEATPIPLRGGESLSVDIHLTPVPALRIVVRNPQNPDNGFVFPQLLKKSFDSNENVTAAMMRGNATAGDGARMNDFIRPNRGYTELVGIPAGKYTVFMPDNTGQTHGTVGEVELNRDGQEISTDSGDATSSVSFQVRVLGENAIPSELVLLLQRSDIRTTLPAPVDSQGKAEFVRVPPGKYNVLAFTSSTQYNALNIAADGASTAGSSIEVTAGAHVEAQAVLARGRAKVEGFARRNGKGVAGAMIVLVPKDPDNHSDLLRRDQSDLDGSFSLPDVIPGEYTILAIDDGWELHWSEPGVLAHYLPQGRNITVQSGSLRLSDDVPVQPK